MIRVGRHALAAMASLACATGLSAQAPASVGGRVLDAKTGRPVEAADVLLGDAIVITSADGVFLFGSVPDGRLELRVRRIGYAPVRSAIEMLPGTTVRRDILLWAQAVSLDSLVVTGPAAGPEIGHGALLARGRTLAMALEGWEGIAIRAAPDGSAAPTIRGSAPDEVLVLLDGFPLNDPYTGRTDLRRVSSNDVATVRLHPGAQGATHGGRALAGVIDIQSRSQVGSEAQTWAGSHGVLGGGMRFGAGSVAVAASAEGLPADYAYDIPPVRGQGEGVRENTGGRIWGLNARRTGSLEVLVRGSASDRGLPGPVTNPTTHAQATDWSVLAGVRRRGSLEVSASVQALGSHYRDAKPPVGLAYDSRGGGLELGSRVAQTVALGHDGAGHLVLAAEGARTAYSGDGIPDGATQWRTGLIAQGEWLPNSAFSVTPTIRLDWWTDLGRVVGSGRLEAQARLAGTTTFSLAAGSSVAPPVLADLFFREGNGVRVNPDLRPERIPYEFEAGVRHAGRLAGIETEGSLRGYWGRVDDMVLWGQSPAYHFAWTPQNFDVIRRGGEVSLLLRPLSGVSASGSASLSRVTRPWDGAPQIAYRPYYTVAALLTMERARWRIDARYNRLGERYRDYRGLTLLPAITTVGVGGEVAPFNRVRLRADIADLLDARPAFVAGYPSPGRAFTATLTLELP